MASFVPRLLRIRGAYFRLYPVVPTNSFRIAGFSFRPAFR
jgi:hypothetical protein